ncbi:unnamed protein product, partial [Ectocarpus sp. 12 AP-2014]
MDEAGDHWIHMLFRYSANPWAARSGLNGVVDKERHDKHNHFDWLELGAEATSAFEHKIRGGQQQPEDPKETPPSPDFGPTGRQKSDVAKGQVRLKYKSCAGKDGKRLILPSRTTLGSDGSPKKKSRVFGKKSSQQSAGSGTRAPLNSKDAGIKKEPAAGGRTKQRARNLEPHASYDSDGSIGEGGKDWTHHKTPGASTTLTRSERKFRADMKKIKEPDYQEAFRLSNKRKAHGDKLLAIVEEAEKKAKDAAAAVKAAQGGKPAAPTKKPVKRRQAKPVVEEEEEEEVHPSWAWSERGIPEYEETDAYKRRNKKT